MADNVIRVNVTTVAPKSISIQGSREQNYINATGDTSGYNAQLAKNWAIGEGKIQGIDYSSKHYAGVAKENAELSSENLSNVQEIVAGFGETAGNATNELAQVKNDAVIEISNLNTSVIEGIETASNGAIAEIEVAGASAVADVATNKNTAISSIEAKGQEQIKNIEKTGFFMENDKLFFINSKGEVEEFSSGGGTLNMFDTVLKDHILSFEESKGLALQGTYVYKDAIAGSRYGYPTFYEKCLEEKEAATATETTLGDHTITMYINANGHQFYDIADKEAVDAWYNIYGRAWFYGVDTENERIFLPRNNKYFRIGDESTVGTNQEAGLPNIEGTIEFRQVNTGGGDICFGTGSFTRTMDGDGYVSGLSYTSSSNKGAVIHLDPSRSSSIYGNSDTVELDSVNMLLYICVGNTESEEAITDVTEVTTTENDTIPLGYSVYQANGQPSVSWLKSSGQWNDGNVYTTFYNEFVQKIGQAFAGGTVVEYTSEYTDYDLVINQTDMTFRLPLLDGSEDLPSEKYIDLTLGASGDTYTAPANGWFYISKTCNANYQYVTITNMNSSLSSSTDGGNTFRANAYIPTLKGDSVKITYTTGMGSTNFFRFIYAQGNGSLYFKVANAVQNLELLNAGEVLEAVNNVVPNNRTVWDGQWVQKYLEVAYSVKAIGSYSYDLSGYLPDDGYTYEVMFDAYVNSDAITYYTVGTAPSPKTNKTTCFYSEIVTLDTEGRAGNSTFTLPIDSSRTVYLEIANKAVSTTSQLYAVGYRRIGTNV